LGTEVSQHNTIANKLSVQNTTGISEKTLNMNKFTYKQKQTKANKTKQIMKLKDLLHLKRETKQ
jgi:hypothetical protein